MTTRTLKLDDCPSEDSRIIKGWEQENSIMIWGVQVRLSTAPVIRDTPRHYFDCPACDRRCCKLFRVGDEVRCQRCSGLLYASQSRSWSERSVRRIGSLKRKLGSPHIFGVTDVRPRYMHEKTYFWLRNKLKAVYNERAEYVRTRLFPSTPADPDYVDSRNNPGPQEREP